MDDLVPNMVKVQIISQEIAMWRNTLFQFRMRHKVNKAIGADPQVLKQVEDEMVKCESSLEVLKDELDALGKEAKLGQPID